MAGHASSAIQSESGPLSGVLAGVNQKGFSHRSKSKGKHESKTKKPSWLQDVPEDESRYSETNKESTVLEEDIHVEDDADEFWDK